MKQYFQLADGVFLVQGAKRYALYDTNLGLVYSLNADAVEVLHKVSLGAGSNKDHQFAKLLEAKGLLVAVDGPSPLYITSSKNNPFKNVSQYRLEFVWIELTNRCNLRCIHCYANSGNGIDTKELSLIEWERVLYDVFAAGARHIQFIGGEPLLYHGFDSLVAKASDLGFESIEIFTNGLLVRDNLLGKLASYAGNIRFALSLYSHHAHTHDSITTVKGSWERTIRAIKQIREYGFPVRVETIIMKQNQDDIEQTMRLIESLGAYSWGTDVVRPTGRGSDVVMPTKADVLLSRVRTEPNFNTSLAKFKKALYWNSCWAGKLAITSKGDVIPCIFARDIILGSILTETITSILQSPQLALYWRLTKDKISVCKDCEYRYACHDCRPLVTANGQGMFDRGPFCTYNPYDGSW